MLINILYTINNLSAFLTCCCYLIYLILINLFKNNFKGKIKNLFLLIIYDEFFYYVQK